VSATGPFGYAYGATDFSRMASYTNYGNSLVSIAAPGGDFAWPTEELCAVNAVNNTVPLVNVCWVFDMVLSTTRGSATSAGGYGWAAGTSMAAPAVAAVAALVKQKYPGITVDKLQKHIEKTATPAGSNATHGAGYLNAAAAVAN
jgi:subtilisin family serine protease